MSSSGYYNEPQTKPFSIRPQPTTGSGSQTHNVQFSRADSFDSVEKTDPANLTIAAEARREFRHSMRVVAKSSRSFKHRFLGKDRWVPWGTSWKNIAKSSMLNILLIFVPIAWILSVNDHISSSVAFLFLFLAIIPLEKMFDYGGEQMAHYLGGQLGDLVVITLNNAVEAILAIFLLLGTKCELKLLQTTITGVVVLHLLLIPGMAFLTGGARIWEQNLHAHPTQLNHSLLTLGVLSILLPTAMFSAMNSNEQPGVASDVFTNGFRQTLLDISRIMAITLLIVYVGSRIYLYNPDAEESTASEAIKHHEEELREAKPEVNVWSCIMLLIITIVIMGFTAELLVRVIEPVQHHLNLTESWFGMILIPFVSFSGDAVVASIYFLRYTFRIFFRNKPEPPAELAKGRSIDMAIQFLIFWLPVFILLGWMTGRPFHLMFDYFEVAILLGCCFLVNYITADAKTNWAEGLMMCAFYFMIAVVVFRYEGQAAAHELLVCSKVGAEALGSTAGHGSAASSGSGSEGHGAGAGEAAGSGQSGHNETSVEEVAAHLIVRAVTQLMARREL